MAHMYPKIFPADNLSSGERKVFDYFNNHAPDDWHILHSFRLPKHKQVVFGEADFIILAPRFGIFVLEVKSGGVGFDGTHWIYINREGNAFRKQRGPFQQASEAMFRVEKIISDKLGAEEYGRNKMLYGYGVIFTDESGFPAKDMTEDDVWRLCQNNGNNDYCSFVKRLSKNFIQGLNAIGKKCPRVLSEEDALTVAKTLRPIVECIKPLKAFIKASESDIITLTTEQFDCLDDIQLNKQIVITGGAGTGKTLLAVEDARRSAQAFERIGFFCYNKNLASYIKANITEPNIEVYTLHSYMEKHIDTTTRLNMEVGGQDYYSKVLPQSVCESFNLQNYQKYNKLIVDEFQDLCTTEYLLVFDKMLECGLINGRFSFYGDFARQAIYNEENSLQILDNVAFYARKHLSVNCRNTQNIGNEMVNVTSFTDKNYRLKILGEPVDYFVWKSQDDQHKLLKDCISDLRKKGFSSESIMVLSPSKRQNSIVGVYDPDGFIIGDYGKELSPYYAMFSTAQSFKGLESEIIILTDINNYSDKRLMYVALSRARSKLIVLESKLASRERKNQIIERS